MPMPWRKEEEETAEEKAARLKKEANNIEFKPEMIAEAINSNDTLKAMGEFLRSQKEKEEKAKADADAAARRKQQEEESELDLLTDPDGYFARKLDPIHKNQLATTALLVKKEVLADKEFMDDPDFKSAVYKLIEAQPLQNQINTSVVDNAYKTVYFDFREKIKEGKMKSQLSLNSGGRGSGGHSGSGSDNTEDVLSDAEKMQARKFGISEKDYAAQKKQMEFV